MPYLAVRPLLPTDMLCYTTQTIDPSTLNTTQVLDLSPNPSGIVSLQSRPILLNVLSYTCMQEESRTRFPID